MFFFIYKKLNTVQSNHFMKLTSDPRVMVELVVRLIVQLAMQTRNIPFSRYYEVSGVITNSFFVKAVKMPPGKHTRVCIPFTSFIARHLCHSLKVSIRDVQQFITTQSQNHVLIEIKLNLHKCKKKPHQNTKKPNKTNQKTSSKSIK